MSSLQFGIPPHVDIRDVVDDTCQQAIERRGNEADAQEGSDGHGAIHFFMLLRHPGGDRTPARQAAHDDAIAETLGDIDRLRGEGGQLFGRCVQQRVAVAIGATVMGHARNVDVVAFIKELLAPVRETVPDSL